MTEHAPLILDVAGLALTAADRRRLADPATGGLILSPCCKGCVMAGICSRAGPHTGIPGQCSTSVLMPAMWSG